MTLAKSNMLYSGKAKSLYETEEPAWLIVEFRDDTTAFDGAKKEKLANKGRVNNLINAKIMSVLKEAGIPTHFEQLLTPTESIVRRLKMIPLECVIRNRAAGSLCRRLGVTPEIILDPPLFELFLKNDALHDPLINENHAISFGWATPEQLEKMKALTFKINTCLTKLFQESGLLLIDAKFEFGVAGEQIYLGDEITPDSCRLWDLETRKPLDKDRFRQDLGGVVEAYQEVGERLGVAVFV